MVRFECFEGGVLEVDPSVVGAMLDPADGSGTTVLVIQGERFRVRCSPEEARARLGFVETKEERPPSRGL